MKLYVVRHGDYDTKDIFQHLSLKGERDIQRAAEYLKDHGALVQEIWHSPKTRAVESADIFQAVLRCPVIKEKECLSPDAPSDIVSAALAAEDQDILVISHLPLIPRLLTELLQQGSPSSFPTAAVAVLERTAGGWRYAEFINPEVLV